MKEHYSFYYTVEEHRAIEKKTRIFSYINVALLFCIILFWAMSMLCIPLEFTEEDPYPYFTIGLMLLSGLGIVILTALPYSRKNRSPSREFWYDKQEYTIEGNKVTIQIRMATGLTKTDEFIIAKREERPEGIYLYKAFYYYIVIPYRVKPTILTD